VQGIRRVTGAVMSHKRMITRVLPLRHFTPGDFPCICWLRGCVGAKSRVRGKGVAFGGVECILKVSRMNSGGSAEKR
jgi:hypothetical protein